MMINKKEDLINTYIEKGDWHLTTAYLDACEPHIDVHLCRVDRYPDDSHFYFNPSAGHLQSGECDTERYKKLTLSDLKPEENMKTYGTFQECKIANPECEIYTDGGLFTAEMGTSLDTKCNPAEYCMTVEEFLKDGYEFKVSDLYLTSDGRVEDVHNDEFAEVMNAECTDILDKNRYILRAAALEKPKRTKVEYVKVTDSIWHLESDFKAGDLFAFDGQDNYVQVETEGDFTLSHSADNLYRRIETPMTEREVFIEAACEINERTHGERRQYIVESLFDSGKFKLVN